MKNKKKEKQLSYSLNFNSTTNIWERERKKENVQIKSHLEVTSFKKEKKKKEVTFIRNFSFNSSHC